MFHWWFSSVWVEFWDECGHVSLWLRLCLYSETWAIPEWSPNPLVCTSLSEFTDGVCTIFDHSNLGLKVARSLTMIRQGSCCAADCDIELRTIAAECGWNDSSLLDAFHHGLSDSIKYQLVAIDWLTSLDSFIALEIKIANLTSMAWTSTEVSVPGLPATPEEPIQLGRTCLCTEERKQRIREGQCIYCRELGHVINQRRAKGVTCQWERGHWWVGLSLLHLVFNL